MKNRKGSIEIVFLTFIICIFIILSFIVYILYVQITTYVIPIKQDLFYIVQNSYFSLNQNKLEYEDYIVNNNELRKRVHKILSINHPEVILSNIYYNYNNNKIYVEIIINIKPIVLGEYIKNIKIKIKDTIKLKMMEVKYE